MDIPLQEDVLDEIERLCNDPSLLNRYSSIPAESFDVIREVGDRIYYVFVTVECDPRRKHIEVASIGQFAKPR